MQVGYSEKESAVIIIGNDVKVEDDTLVINAPELDEEEING